MDFRALIDAADLPLVCPHCSHEFSQTGRRLRAQPDVTCPACSGTFAVDLSQVDEAAGSAQHGLQDFERRISKTIKLNLKL